MGKITDACGHKPILESLEPRLLLDGMTAEQAIELFHTTGAVFAENQGQWASSVRFVHRGQGASIAHTDSGPVFELFREAAGAEAPADLGGTLNGEPDAEPAEMERLRFSASFDGANAVSPVGLAQSESRFNFFVGEQAQWRHNAPSYEIVAYEGLYDGVDLHTWGLRDHLKYEFHVAPGADFSQISVSYSGIDALEIDAAGALHVRLPGDWGEVVDDTPYIYQIVDGVQVEVAGAYRLVDTDTYAFEITGSYDPTRRLIIDPDLDWSTYLGGSSGDRAYGIAADADGNVLVTGYTWSSGWVSGGWDTSLGGGGDVFVVKLSASGEHLWSSYLGGSSSDYGYGIAADADGNVLVTGRTQSSGWVSGGWDTDIGGSSDGFVVKLSASGGHLWSTYLGAGSWEEGHGIATDASGNALVTGSTESSGWISGGWLASYGGGRDVFVVKLSASGGHLWSTYLGGSEDDRSYGIAVDASGDALVTGYTYSSGWVSGGWDASYGGGGDVFVVKLSASGGHLWSTYLGGSSSDYGYGIAADGAGDALVTGYTGSAGWVSGGWDANHGGGGDGFVVKLSASGGHLWSTYLGGSSSDYGYGIAADASGDALVTGYTGSADWISGGLETNHGGSYDGFVVKLSASGGHLWSTYLGGSGDDRGYGIATDAAGDALVTGETESAGWTSGGTDSSHNGFADAFVAKLTGLVTISDPGLEQAIRDALGKPAGYLTEDDMESLTSLDASSRNITNLEGLQNCTNLVDLDLSGNQISDLQRLVDNTGLNGGDTVDVMGNPLSTLSLTVHIPALEGRGVTVDYFIPVTAVPDVVGRYIFYNNSVFDGGAPEANVNDDNAIAQGKTPLLPGGIASLANYSSYSRGINGIMVDIDELSGTPTAGDFGIRVNEAMKPDTWSAGPASTVSVRLGDGVGGSDRVTLIWADGAILNQWVEVTVLSDAGGGSLGLAGNDVFYFGNAVGDCDGDGQIGSSDYGTLVSQFGRSEDGLAADFDGSGRVDLVDFAILRDNFGNTLPAPAAAPEAPLTAPPATLQAVSEPIAGAATSMRPVVSQPLDDNDANNDSIATTASAPAVDLLVESPSPGSYISGPQPISVGIPATMRYRAATAEYDLRPPGDDLTASEADDLLADMLAESLLAVPL